MIRFLTVLTALAVTGFAAHAQTAQPRIASHCIALAQSAPGLTYLHHASETDNFRAPLPEFDVRIHYLSHASFLIQSPGGASAVTDFTGYIGNVDFLPDVVTMNHAHDTHWTAFPDPAIPHVLKGWGESFGAGIDHNLMVKDMKVRNVSTDIRSHSGVEPEGNSIFVFEAAGLCIGHLGHLHHEPDAAQYAALGRMDVVMAPVDGGMTLDLDTMTKVLKRLRASVVIPMHWFGRYTLDRFLADMSDQFAIERTGKHSLQLSLRDLPKTPTVVVLEPRHIEEYE